VSSQANQGEASISLPAARSGLYALRFLLGTMGMHVLYALESSNCMVDKHSGSCTATTSLNEKAAKKQQVCQLDHLVFVKML
jgi:hypothetical protein